MPEGLSKAEQEKRLAAVAEAKTRAVEEAKQAEIDAQRRAEEDARRADEQAQREAEEARLAGEKTRRAKAKPAAKSPGLCRLTNLVTNRQAVVPRKKISAGQKRKTSSRR